MTSMEPTDLTETQRSFLDYLDREIRAAGQAPSLRRAAADLGRKVFFLASTDLTHYGPNYGFSPKGRGTEALEWVRDVNDAGFIAALFALDGREVIRRGNEDKAACSPGAAAAAVGFSRALGYTNPRLCGYYTSHDVHPSESFVGYCSVVYE
ncbi:AmmeMemoRadiSam system protein B [Desulfococcus sp.]|uniref:AmmeMemoRadiSam system protein B n=1 Tax=Desulfococcus sp. TaxID=2025834 RepID=UPI0035938921